MVRGIAIGAAALLVLGCASDHREPHPDLARVWHDYLTLPAERALAIAGDPRRDRWVTGSSGGDSSRDEAEERALAECKRRRAQRRLQDACQIYAIGDEIVWAGPE